MDCLGFGRERSANVGKCRQMLANIGDKLREKKTGVPRKLALWRVGRGCH